MSDGIDESLIGQVTRRRSQPPIRFRPLIPNSTRTHRTTPMSESKYNRRNDTISTTTSATTNRINRTSSAPTPALNTASAVVKQLRPLRPEVEAAQVRTITHAFAVDTFDGRMQRHIVQQILGVDMQQDTEAEYEELIQTDQEADDDQVTDDDDEEDEEETRSSNIRCDDSASQIVSSCAVMKDEECDADDERTPVSPALSHNSSLPPTPPPQAAKKPYTRPSAFAFLNPSPKSAIVEFFLPPLWTEHQKFIKLAYADIGTRNDNNDYQHKRSVDLDSVNRDSADETLIPIAEEAHDFDLPDGFIEASVLNEHNKLPKFEVISENIFRFAKQRKILESIAAEMGDHPDDDTQTRCICIKKAPPRKRRGTGVQNNTEDIDNASLTSINCGDRCFNRAVFVECNDSNCAVGAKLCSNRNFLKHATRKPIAEPFRTEFKGWGLRATRLIKAGEFIIEYVGEIIDNDECRRRIASENAIMEVRQHRRDLVKKQLEQLAVSNRNARRLSDRFGRKRLDTVFYDSTIPLATPQSRATSSLVTADAVAEANYYFLTVCDDVVIDAGRRGGIGRFTNHSCDPNCTVQKWNVGNMLRVGIFAGDQDILPLTELSIDYQYDRIGALERQPCYCKSANCAKFIGGAKQKLTDTRVTAKQRKLLQKKAERREKLAAKAMAFELSDSVCAICSDGGELMMCDGKLADGTHYCPRVYHPECLLINAAARGDWTCPFHFCKLCANEHGGAVSKSAVFCVACSESWCATCATKVEGLVPFLQSNLHAANIIDPSRRSYFFNAEQDSDDDNDAIVPKYVVCTVCQTEPICLTDAEEQQWMEWTRAKRSRSQHVDHSAAIIVDMSDDETSAATVPALSYAHSASTFSASSSSSSESPSPVYSAIASISPTIMQWTRDELQAVREPISSAPLKVEPNNTNTLTTTSTVTSDSTSTSTKPAKRRRIIMCS